jgi:hypothetical protein
LKQKPIRSPKHRKFVASQPCILSGISGDDVHPHHLLRVNSIKGMGLKSCDMWCIPLKAKLHNELHKCGDEIKYLELKWNGDYEDIKGIALAYAKISPDKKIRDRAQEYELQTR